MSHGYRKLQKNMNKSMDILGLYDFFWNGKSQSFCIFLFEVY